jgi:ABC-type antimicrobial peptide transport system permease subunit
MEELFRDAEIKPAFYEPYERLAPEGETGFFFNVGQYMIRSRLPLKALRPSLARLGKQMSPAVDLWDASSVDAQLYASTAPRRVMMWMLMTLGGLGLLMCALGVYAVLAFAVVCRTREAGIRMALGANRSQIRKLFLRQGMRLTANGLGLGTVVALALARYLESQLFGVSAADPWAFAGVLVSLGAAAGVACWLPACRAARADLMAALRYE